MWKRTAPLLIVLSLAMNVAFIGAWVVHAVRADQLVDEAEENGVWCPLHRVLGVTDEQWKRIEPRVSEFRHRSQMIRSEMNRLRTELIELIAADEPDMEAIAAQQEQIRAGHEQMQGLVIEHLLAEKEMLTDQQRLELFDLLRERIACAGPNRIFGFTDAAPPENDSGREEEGEHQEQE